MKALIVQTPPDLREMIIFCLEVRYSLETLDATTSLEVIGTLETNKDIDVFIARSDKVDQKVLDYLKENRPDLPCILYSPEPLKNPDAFSEIKLMATLSESNLVENLYGVMDKIFPPPSKIPSEGDDADFCRIRTNLLLKTSPLPVDIFIRLAANHYVHLFRKGDEFGTDDKDRYLTKKGVSFLYLKNNDSNLIVTSVQSQITSMLNETELDLVRVSSVTQSALISIQDLVSKVGLSEEVQEVIKDTVTLTVKSMDKSLQLKKILRLIQMGNEQYVSRHSLLTAHLACAISAGIEWNSEPTYHKLTLAAFLHDITLKNSNLAAIKNQEELNEKKLGFTPQDIKAYNNHPAEAAAMAAKFHEVPPDVDSIIAQHHELPNGKGFPKSLPASKISPLSAIFIIAHDLGYELLLKGDQFDIKAYCQSRKDEFSKSNFKKALAAVERLDTGGLSS